MSGNYKVRRSNNSYKKNPKTGALRLIGNLVGHGELDLQSGHDNRSLSVVKKYITGLIESHRCPCRSELRRLVFDFRC